VFSIVGPSAKEKEERKQKKARAKEAAELQSKGFKAKNKSQAEKEPKSATDADVNTKQEDPNFDKAAFETPTTETYKATVFNTQLHTVWPRTFTESLALELAPDELQIFGIKNQRPVFESCLEKQTVKFKSTNKFEYPLSAELNEECKERQLNGKQFFYENLDGMVPGKKFIFGQIWDNMYAPTEHPNLEKIRNSVEIMKEAKIGLALESCLHDTLEEDKNLPQFEEEFTKVREAMNIKKSINAKVTLPETESKLNPMPRVRIELFQNVQDLYAKEPKRYNIFQTDDGIVPEMSAIYDKFVENFNLLNTQLRLPKQKRVQELTELQNGNEFPFYKVQNLNKVILAGQRQSEKRLGLENRIEELKKLLKPKTINKNSFDKNTPDRNVSELYDKIPLNVIDFDATFEVVSFPLTKDIQEIVTKKPEVMKIKAFSIPDESIPLAHTLLDCIEISIIRAMLNIHIFVQEIKNNPTQELWDTAKAYFFEKNADMNWQYVQKWLEVKSYVMKNALQPVKNEASQQADVREQPSLRRRQETSENLDKPEQGQGQVNFPHLTRRDEARLELAQRQVVQGEKPQPVEFKIDPTLRRRLEQIGTEQSHEEEKDEKSDSHNNLVNLALKVGTQAGIETPAKGNNEAESSWEAQRVAKKNKRLARQEAANQGNQPEDTSAPETPKTLRSVQREEPENKGGDKASPWGGVLKSRVTKGKTSEDNKEEEDSPEKPKLRKRQVAQKDQKGQAPEESTTNPLATFQQIVAKRQAARENTEAEQRDKSEDTSEPKPPKALRRVQREEPENKGGDEAPAWLQPNLRRTGKAQKNESTSAAKTEDAKPGQEESITKADLTQNKSPEKPSNLQTAKPVAAQTTPSNQTTAEKQQANPLAQVVPQNPQTKTGVTANPVGSIKIVQEKAAQGAPTNSATGKAAKGLPTANAANPVGPPNPTKTAPPAQGAPVLAAKAVQYAPQITQAQAAQQQPSKTPEANLTTNPVLGVTKNASLTPPANPGAKLPTPNAEKNASSKAQSAKPAAAPTASQSAKPMAAKPIAANPAEKPAEKPTAAQSLASTFFKLFK